MLLNSDDGSENWTPAKFRPGRCITVCCRVGVGGLECSSPARVALHRFLAIVRKCRAVKGEAALQERGCQQRREKVEAMKEARSESLEDRRRNDASGSQRQEISFNLAAGLGLLSLIAASKTELDKTMELRRQMEVFLRSIKEEHESKGTTPKPSDSRVAYAVSTTVDGLSNVSPYSLEYHAPSLSHPESGTSFVCDQLCNVPKKEGSLEGIDQLEEELAAELERLEVDMETVELSENQPEATEISSGNTANRSVSVSSEEVIDPQNGDGADDNSEYCGVHPLELERRLHEVLEARQEERIKELEAHLETMKQKLHKKEIEVAWWKDTAKLISKQVPEGSMQR